MQCSTATKHLPAPPLGIQVYKQDLHWALKSVDIAYMGLFGSLGLNLEQKTLNPEPYDPKPQTLNQTPTLNRKPVLEKDRKNFVSLADALAWARVANSAWRA